MRQTHWHATYATSFMSGSTCIISSRKRKIGSTSNTIVYVLPGIWVALSPVPASDVVIIRVVRRPRLSVICGDPVPAGCGAFESGDRFSRVVGCRTAPDRQTVLPELYRQLYRDHQAAVGRPPVFAKTIYPR